MEINIIKTYRAKRKAESDAKEFMNQFSGRPTEMFARKFVTKILAHASGPSWRSIAMKQERELERYKKLFNNIKEN